MLRLLTKDEYKQTFCAPMQNTTYDGEQPVCDIRPYAHEALVAEFPQFDAATIDVELSYRSADGKYEHVLITAGCFAAQKAIGTIPRSLRSIAIATNCVFLVPCSKATAGTKNLYLVVVIFIESKVIYGHFVLDLNREYGLTPEQE